MLFTLTATRPPATDLGYVLAKHPDRTQRFALSFGAAHVFYPEAAPERCTAALLMDVDPVALVRGGRRAPDGKPLAPYVNNRPYVLSSHFSTALSRVFGSALNGTVRHRPELADAVQPLEAVLDPIAIRGGGRLVRDLFEPLGYAVEVTRHPLDPAFPEWGEGPCHRVVLRAETTVTTLLRHLYVLVPVLDDDKHYWVGDDEVRKLLAKGEDWLPEHPMRDAITHRYLARQRSLTRQALALMDDGPAVDDAASDAAEEKIEKPVRLDDARRHAVLEVLDAVDATSVIDLGCGEGKLLRALLRKARFTRIMGIDVSPVALERAAERLRLADLTPRQRARIEIAQGSLTYRDARFVGFEAACAIEVIEHMEPDRLEAFARVVFEAARPPVVIVTTPNVEYNGLFGLETGQRRHADHRFEWTRAEFEGWARAVAERFGYGVDFRGIGAEDPALGAPTQMGVFRR